MLKILPMAGGAILLFLLIIIAAVVSSSNRKRRKTYLEYQNNENIENKANPMQESMLSIPKLDREKREEIEALAQSSRGMETELLNSTVSKGNIGETTLLSSSDNTDFYALLHYKEGEVEKEFKMTDEIINVGRDPETSNFVILSDDYIGRNHATIYFEQGKFYVKDLSSKNGTFVNGIRITESSEIDNGSIIRFGNTDVTFKVNL